MTDTSDSNYWEGWKDPHYDGGLSIQQDLEARGVVFNEQGVPLSGLNQAMAGIDPDWTATGTGSFLASVNPTYSAEQAIYESDDYKRFIEQMKTYNPEALETHGGPQLWAMNQRALEAGTSLFAADTIAGATDTDTFETGDKTRTGGINDEDLSSLKSAFMSALLETGLDTETITQLWNWAETRFTGDSSFTAAQALVEMYDQKAFKDRFPGIAHMRDMDETRRDIPSPREYLEREGKMKQWFNQYGLDSFAANLDNAVAESFIASVGDAELLERMQTASRLIYEAPEAVKDTFAQWYGPAGDAALMAAFLDPDDQVFGNDWKSLTTLKNQAETAEIGGWSKMYMDLDSPIDEAQAQAIGKLGLQQSQIWSKFGSIKEQENLFLEKQGEMDLDMTTHGVAAEFGVDYDTMSGQELADVLKRRSERRSAEFKGGGGAILSGNRTGLGSANA